MEESGVTTLFLVRHGQTEANLREEICGHGDSPLTEEGVAQIRSLAEGLNEISFDAAYTSTLSRAIDSCKGLLNGRGPEPVPLEALREQNYGAWEGRNYKAVLEEYPDLFRKFRTDPLNVQVPGGESLGNFLERVGLALSREVLAGEDKRKILCVVHGGTIGAVLCHLLELDPGRHIFRFGIQNASLTVVRLGPLGTQLVGLGMRDPSYWRF